MSKYRYLNNNKAPIKMNKLINNTKKIMLSISMLMSGITVMSFCPSTMAQNIHAKSSIFSLSFKEKTTIPKVIHIEGTKKIIIDFDEANDFLEVPEVKNNELIDNMSYQRNGKKLRISLDMKEPVQYTVINSGFNYYINFIQASEFSEKSNISKKETIVVKPLDTSPPIKIIEQDIIHAPVGLNESNSIAPIKPVELERMNIKSEGKVAKLTLDLSDKTPMPIIKKEGNLLIVDLPNVKIPEEFQKNISTAHLGTVVQSMDVATQKGNGRIVLSQNDGWEYSSYQMDKKVVISINSINKDALKPVYKGKPLTLDFQNMDVRSILHVVADFSGLNIIASDSVNGTMTIRLNNVPWDQVLDLILEARNLQKQRDGNVVWVATRQEITDKNKSQLELNNQAADLAPLKLEFYQLNHYKAKEMKEIIEGKTSSNNGGSATQDKSESHFALLSKRGSVGLDVRNNTIFIQDTESKLEEIKKIIKRLDIASKQVLIEAKLVVVDDKFQKDIGAKFGFALGKKNNSTGIGISNNSSDATSVANRSSTSGSAFDQAVTGGGSIGFTILNAITGNMLNIELSALEENNRGKVISNPRLLTADNKKAEIRQGTEIPYVTPGSNNSPATVSFKDAVLSLGVTPQVSPNGRVTMDLDISKDTVGQLVNVQGGGQVPSIDTRKITTQVTVNDGQTVVLGGIYEITSRDDLSKVPLLGDIPWIGNLFKNTSRSNEKVELLIFITPHVIYDEDLDNINKNEKGLNEIDFKKK